MRSETECREELEELQRDLQTWRLKFEKCTDKDRRRILGNTINGVEGRIEALEWVLK